MQALQENNVPSTIPGDFPQYSHPLKGHIMAGDIAILLQRLDRFEDKFDELGAEMRDGAREFGQIQEKLTALETRTKTLESRFWGITSLCVITCIGVLLKAALT